MYFLRFFFEYSSKYKREQFIEKIAFSVIFISSNNPLDLFEQFIESINKNPILFPEFKTFKTFKIHNTRNKSSHHKCYAFKDGMIKWFWIEYIMAKASVIDN